MKFLIGLLVLGGIALGAVYFLGGTNQFDPNEQGRKARAAIQPGMSWKKVVEVAGAPKRYQTFIPRGEKGLLQPGASVKFDRASMETELKNNVHKHGYQFNYLFTEAIAFDVVFDPQGNVTHVQNQTTVADLLDQKR